MSVERVSLDSNILFYTIDGDAGDRQRKAREIVRQAALGDWR
jgi:predicted nucleic acid-binding protein